MGNSQSSDSPKPSSAHVSPSSRRDREKDVPSAKKALSHATKAHTPPSASLVASSSLASTSTSATHVHATVSAIPASSHSRPRSVTASDTPAFRSDQLASGPKSDVSHMGNVESRHRPPSRSATLPPPATENEEHPLSPGSQPVDVPHYVGEEHNEKDFVSSRVHVSGSYGLPPGDFSRPPRLPLPIETEHEPGSPLPSPKDAGSPLDPSDVGGTLARRTSMLSSTTLDDDDAAEIEAFAMESDPSLPKVPTTIEWRGPGKVVYVTGTFVNWERKFRLHRNSDNGGFSATIPLPSGTHHMKFLVDGDMMTSHDLPTTVDYTNILVNYIEIVAPMPPPSASQPSVPAKPMPIPGAAINASQAERIAESAARPLDIRPGAQRSEAHTPSGSIGADALHPTSQQSASIVIPQHGEQQQHKTKQKLPRPKYTTEIPLLLLHLDLYNQPEDERFRRASKAIQGLPHPPSLPLFMGKSILNTATPHKDDASVLAMPNHTVLNHLATSSIRDGVLATSGTTRYKRKFLTTIMYKPTSDDG